MPAAWLTPRRVCGSNGAHCVCQVTCRDTGGRLPVLSLGRQCCRNSACAQLPCVETSENIASAPLCCPFPAKCAHPDCLISRVQSTLSAISCPASRPRDRADAPRSLRTFSIFFIFANRTAPYVEPPSIALPSGRRLNSRIESNIPGVDRYPFEA
jgi:hypothetical protein